MKDYGHYGNLAKKEWKRLRPKMYRQLVASGQLDKALKDAQEKTSNMVAELMRKGLQEFQAEEIALPMFVSPPSESDQPALGESSELNQEITE